MGKCRIKFRSLAKMGGITRHICLKESVGAGVGGPFFEFVFLLSAYFGKMGWSKTVARNRRRGEICLPPTHGRGGPDDHTRHFSVSTRFCVWIHRGVGLAGRFRRSVGDVLNLPA